MVFRFVYDAGGAPVAFYYNNTLYYYEKNLQGDVIGIVDSSGVQIARYKYDAWGNLLSGFYAESGYWDIYYYNPFRYRGYFFDYETGFYFLQSRYYDPAIGRFINADGYVSTGQGFLGYNMYAYCNNNPVIFVDKNGNAAAGVFQNYEAIYLLLGIGGGAAAAAAGVLLFASSWLVDTVITETKPLPHETPATVEPPPAELVYPEAPIEVKPKVEIPVESPKSRPIGKYDDLSPRKHHIVAQNDRRADQSREVLDAVGINYVTDIRNLVVIPHGYHKSMHTDKYYLYVDSVILSNQDNQLTVTMALIYLKTQIYFATVTGYAPWH